MPETASVREYFPKVPPKCYECPGLVAAACRLRKEGMHPVDTGPSLVDDDGALAETDLAMAGLEQAVEATARGAVLPHGPQRAVGALASVVHWGCTEGVIISRQIKRPQFLPWLLGRRRSKVVVTRQCGSLSPAAYIVPEVSTEERMVPGQGEGEGSSR